MNENDRRVSDVKTVGIAFRSLTLIRLGGGAFALLGLRNLVEVFLSNQSFDWLKLVGGIIEIAFAILFLFARSADTKDT